MNYKTINIYGNNVIEIKSGDRVMSPVEEVVVVDIIGDHVGIKYDDGQLGMFPISSVVFLERAKEGKNINH